MRRCWCCRWTLPALHSCHLGRSSFPACCSTPAWTSPGAGRLMCSCSPSSSRLPPSQTWSAVGCVGYVCVDDTVADYSCRTAVRMSDTPNPNDRTTLRAHPLVPPTVRPQPSPNLPRKLPFQAVYRLANQEHSHPAAKRADHFAKNSMSWPKLPSEIHIHTGLA